MDNSKIFDMGLDIKTYEEIVDLIVDKKNGDSDLDWSEICDKYNLPLGKDSLRKANDTIFGGAFIAEYFRNRNTDETEVKVKCAIEDEIKHEQNRFGKKLEMNKDGSYKSEMITVLNDEQSKDPEFLMSVHGFDPDRWSIVSTSHNVRQVLRGDSDEPVELYFSRITVKPNSSLSMAQIKKFYDELKEKDLRETVPYNKNYSLSGLMFELPIQDVHFGKLSHTEDVAEPYNYSIAKERFNKVVSEAIDSIKDMNIEKIIFPIGNDYFHIDNMENATTAGTRQDTDLSAQLIFKYGVECLISNILKLSEIAPVEVFCINGNHDFLTSYHAICAIDCYFANNKNVIVNTSTSPRKYIEFGDVLLGFTHGDKEKNRLDGIMQVEAREAWGRTKYHEFHCGHLHSEQVRETNGIIIRNLSSFTGTDGWHHRSGWIGAVKKIQSFLWDRHKGLRAIMMNTID